MQFSIVVNTISSSYNSWNNQVCIGVVQVWGGSACGVCWDSSIDTSRLSSKLLFCYFIWVMFIVAYIFDLFVNNFISHLWWKKFDGYALCSYSCRLLFLNINFCWGYIDIWIVTFLSICMVLSKFIISMCLKEVQCPTRGFRMFFYGNCSCWWHCSRLEWQPQQESE